MLAVLPLLLVACDNGGQGSSSESVIHEWLEEDVATMMRVHPTIMMPYDTNLFGTYSTTTIYDETSSEITLESNYDIMYDDMINKVILTYTTVDVGDVESYYEYCVSNDGGFTLDEQLSDVENHDYYVYQNIINNSENISRYYINIYFMDNQMMTAIAYVENTSIFKSWNSEYVDSVFGLDPEAEGYVGFPATDETTTKIIATEGRLEGYTFIEMVVESASSDARENYIESLVSAGFKNDPYFDTKTRLNYYLVDTENDQSLDVFIDKTSSDNTFTMQLKVIW